MYNPSFKISPRENWMMPTPFVLTDAVVIQQKIKPTVQVAPTALSAVPKMMISKDSTSQNIDTLKTK